MIALNTFWEIFKNLFNTLTNLFSHLNDTLFTVPMSWVSNVIPNAPSFITTDINVSLIGLISSSALILLLLIGVIKAFIK